MRKQKAFQASESLTLCCSETVSACAVCNSSCMVDSEAHDIINSQSSAAARHSGTAPSYSRVANCITPAVGHGRLLQLASPAVS